MQYYFMLSCEKQHSNNVLPSDTRGAANYAAPCTMYTCTAAPAAAAVGRSTGRLFVVKVYVHPKQCNDTSSRKITRIRAVERLQNTDNRPSTNKPTKQTCKPKSFLHHNTHRAALIYISLALSQTPVYTARPRIRG